MAIRNDWLITSDDDVMRLLHHVDGHLGLAVYRCEGDTAQWKAEATQLIGRLRNAISYMQARAGADKEGVE